MIRKALSQILANYDWYLMDATTRVRFRENNLSDFGKILYEDLTRIVKEVAETDPRISFEEKNRGFYIMFDGHILFRAAVNVFSERTELLVNKIQIISYDGVDGYHIVNYKHGKASAAIESAVLATFNNTLHDYLNLQIKRI